MLASRIFPLMLLFGALFLALTVKVYLLQVVRGEQALTDVADTMTKTISTPSSRGNIYDCNGVLLAYNELVQNVTVTDNGAYQDGYERNLMLLRLISILDAHGETVQPTLPLYLDEKGTLQTNFSSETARLRFLRDMYGVKNVNQLTEEQRSASAQDIFDFFVKKFGVGSYRNGSTYLVTTDQALKCLHIRYALYSNYYVRYNPTTVALNVKEKTAAAILEHAAELSGVEIENSYVRRYNNAVYFSHIIGYTGKASTEEIQSLNAAGGNYVSGDVIGKSGIEASMETSLQGTKGTKTVYVNNLGQIQKVIGTEDCISGDDVYLSVDAKLQIGIYFLLEQKLAGILISNLVNEGTDPHDEDHRISVKAAYNQLIANNILDFEAFEKADNNTPESRLFRAFTVGQSRVLSDIRKLLTSVSPEPYEALSEDKQQYLDELYDVLLSEEILLRDKIDVGSPMYAAYRIDGTVSLQEYLRYALENGWVDTGLLSLEGDYTSSEQVYRELVELILPALKESRDFSKSIYKNLIYNNTIKRCDLALALFSQHVLEYDEEWVDVLSVGTDNTAFEFMKKVITSMELTPAMLALDPCSAAATLVDPNTGKVKAMVAYPGYDNNRINEPDYYLMLLEDMSSPLFNTATQAQCAPGSVFKLVTSAATLELGTMDPNEKITTKGVFTEVGMNLECSIYPDTHGDICLREALRDSCNYFFCEACYRFSMVDDRYSDSTGLDILQKYASLMGLGEKSGVEVAEYVPHISTTSAIASAIGQGSNLYSNVQLARYVTAVATSGNLYGLTLLDHTVQADGTFLKSYHGELLSKTKLSEETWYNIHTGMHLSATEGSTAPLFSHKVDLASKTGTAQESSLRPDHATFVAYAPYKDPQVCLAVSILHGYTSGNTAEVGGYILDFYFGHMDLDDILTSDARDIGGGIVRE